VVPSTDTQRIQEAQLIIIHLLCELVEDLLYKERPSSLTRYREEVRPPADTAPVEIARAAGRRRVRAVAVHPGIA
jgi:hypothetical protein